MELVKLTHENVEKEHICCAISNNKDIQGICCWKRASRTVKKKEKRGL